jgi:tetratricopeptide (TPR) repeat protein
VLVDNRGQTIDRWSGYADVAGFITTLHDAESDLATVTEKQARFESKPDGPTAARLARVHETQFEFADAAKLYRRAQELDPGHSSKYAFPLFQALSVGYDNKTGVTFDDMRTAADGALASKETSPQQKLALGAMMSIAAKNEKNPKAMLPYLKAALAASEGTTDPDALKRRRSLLVDQALYVDGDKQKAVQLKRESMPENWMQNAQQLNRYAWWCFENQVDLEQAEVLARKGIELAKAGSEKAMICDTAAEICNLRGNCKDSVSLMQVAVVEYPKNEEYPKKLERFQKLLAERR